MPEGFKVDVEGLKDEIDYVVRWIKNFVEKAGVNSVVIGLSGGIDSAVVAHLCVRALGPERVLALNMPCESNPKDEEHARMVAEQLGIRYIVYDLSAVYSCMRTTLRGRESFLLVEGANVKARLRMATLYASANGSNKGRLVVGTGNKTEHKVGYFTKYGDGATDFEPICDFYKSEVREIARILGVPQEIIDKPPSAGLWRDQTDEEDLGITYEELDKTLDAIDRVAQSGNLLADQEQHLREYILIPYGISFDQFNMVCDMMSKARHKTETPPYYRAWSHLD